VVFFVLEDAVASHRILSVEGDLD